MHEVTLLSWLLEPQLTRMHTAMSWKVSTANVWFIVLCCCYFVCVCHNLSCKVMSDSLSALQASVECYYQWDAQQCNLISGIQTAIQEAAKINVTFLPSQVKGHQNWNPWNTLDLEAPICAQCANDHFPMVSHTLYSGYSAYPLQIFGEAWIPSIHNTRILCNQANWVPISLQ